MGAGSPHCRTLLTGFTELLREALDLMRELGGADDRSDLSYVSQPSISEHDQNSSFRDWTALIELNRDAWQAAAAVSPESGASCGGRLVKGYPTLCSAG